MSMSVVFVIQGSLINWFNRWTPNPLHSQLSMAKMRIRYLYRHTTLDSFTSTPSYQAHNSIGVRQPRTMARTTLLNVPWHPRLVSHPFKHFLLQPVIHTLILLAHQIRTLYESAFPRHRVHRRREGRCGLTAHEFDPRLGFGIRNVVVEYVFGIIDQQIHSIGRLDIFSASK